MLVCWRVFTKRQLIFHQTKKPHGYKKEGQFAKMCRNFLRDLRFDQDAVQSRMLAEVGAI